MEAENKSLDLFNFDEVCLQNLSEKPWKLGCDTMSSCGVTATKSQKNVGMFIQAGAFFRHYMGTTPWPWNEQLQGHHSPPPPHLLLLTNLHNASHSWSRADAPRYFHSRPVVGGHHDPAGLPVLMPCRHQATTSNRTSSTKNQFRM